MKYMNKSLEELHKMLKNGEVTSDELIKESLELSHEVQEKYNAFVTILDEPNLREVQTFPTSSTGQDAMMGSPSILDSKQLDELGLKIVEED